MVVGEQHPQYRLPAGRGMAVELGAAGATVYVTGRILRRQERPDVNAYR
jgi:hypothetical protein